MSRWMYLLKLWEKAELNIKAALKSDGTLHKSIRNFLQSLQTPKTRSPPSNSVGTSSFLPKLPSPHIIPPFAKVPLKATAIPPSSQQRIHSKSSSPFMPQRSQDEAVDEGILLDSDSSNDEEEIPSESRKRGQCDLPTPPLKRIQITPSTQSCIHEGGAGEGSIGSQSLFASVMSQANTGNL